MKGLICDRENLRNYRGFLISVKFMICKEALWNLE